MKIDEFYSLPVSTRVSVAFAQGRAENAFLLTRASFGLASLLAGAAKGGGGSFLLAEACVFVPVVLRVDAVPLPLAEPRGHAPPLLTDPLHERSFPPLRVRLVIGGGIRLLTGGHSLFLKKGQN